MIGKLLAIFRRECHKGVRKVVQNCARVVLVYDRPEYNIQAAEALPVITSGRAGAAKLPSCTFSCRPAAASHAPRFPAVSTISKEYLCTGYIIFNLQHLDVPAQLTYTTFSSSDNFFLGSDKRIESCNKG